MMNGFLKNAVLLAAVMAGSFDVFAEFEPVPRQSLVELKATVGKPFSSGLVFINGKFIPPPYRIQRYGTVLRVNEHQVTGQLISWNSFLRTQEGVKLERVEVPASEQTTTVEEVVEQSAPAEDLGDDFDDLFDDTPVAKKKTVRKVVKKVVPAAPRAETKVSFDGQFVHNAKTKAMLKRLNKARTGLELALRKGSAFFFGPNYSTVRADRGPADMFLQKMPSVMRNSNSFEQFASDVRANGIVFLSDDVLQDIYRNKIDYFMLQERAKAVKEERKWEMMLNRQ